MKKRPKTERGQSIIEYALVVTLVAVVLVAALTAMEGGVSTAFVNIVGSL